MLRLRGLLIAVVVLAALVGGVYWSNKAKEAEAKKPPSNPSTPTILDIPKDQITKLEIRRPAGETTVAELKSGKWELTAPRPLAADQGEVKSIVNALSPLTSDRLIESKASNLGQFGLVTPSLDVQVTQKSGKSRQLLIGDEVPTGSGYYVKLANDPRVFMMASYTKTTFDKTEKDLRDKRLLTFNPNSLTRVELWSKGQTIEFGKNNANEWQILKPRPLRADGGLVEELIRKLQDARLDASLSEEDAQKVSAEFASAAPAVVASVTDGVGTQQLQVKKGKDGNYYARSSVVQGEFKVTSDLGDALSKGLDDFRNKKVFDFGWVDPAKIDVKNGSASVSYQRSGDKWTSGGKEMDRAALDAVIEKLRGLTATKFPEQGFTTPSLEVTVTWGGGKRVEKASFSKTGNDWFAMRENEPTIYQLDANVVEELQKALASVKQAAPAKTAKK
jgi:hypothetical protein